MMVVGPELGEGEGKRPRTRDGGLLITIVPETQPGLRLWAPCPGNPSVERTEWMAEVERIWEGKREMEC